MSGAADHALAIEEASLQVSLEAGAIEVCPAHDYVTIRQFDADLERRAYAIGTNRWKNGGLGWTRDELMDAIKDCIEQGADECPRCAELRDA